MSTWSQAQNTIGKYTIKIGGKEVDNWTSFSVEDTLDLKVNQGTITFPDFKPISNILFVNQDVQILRDGVLCWRGLGMKYENVVNAQNMRDWNLTCASNKIYLNREIFRKNNSVSYTYGGAVYSLVNCQLYNAGGIYPFPPLGSPATQATGALDVFNDILNCQYTTKLTLGKTDSSYPHVILQVVRQNAMYALNQLLAGSLCEARFNPDNTIDFQKTAGNRTPSVNFIEGMNLLDFRYQYGIDQFVNDPVVVGQGSGSNQIYVEPNNNTSSLATFGRYSKIYNFGNVNDSNTLLAYANALQVDLQKPIYTIDLLVNLNQAGVPFKVGDVVNVTSPTLGLNNSAYRIIQIKRSYDAGSGEQLTLTVQPNARLVSLTHARLKALEYILNNQTQIQQIVNNTVNPSPSAYSTGLTMGFASTGVQESNCYIYGSGTTMALNYVNSFSGIFTGATVEAVPFWSSTPGTVGLQIYDASNGDYVFIDNSNVTSGNLYSYIIPSAYDIIDHEIVFFVYWQNSGQQVNCDVYLNFNSPTVPT